MCSKAETKEVLQEVLFERGEDGTTYIGREVNRHIDNKANQIVTQLTYRFGIPFVLALTAGAGAWYSLKNEVSNNTNLINEGGRYTQEEADVYAASVDRRFEGIDKDLDEIKEDTRAIRSLLSR